MSLIPNRSPHISLRVCEPPGRQVVNTELRSSLKRAGHGPRKGKNLAGYDLAGQVGGGGGFRCGRYLAVVGVKRVRISPPIWLNERQGGEA